MIQLQVRYVKIKWSIDFLDFHKKGQSDLIKSTRGSIIFPYFVLEEYLYYLSHNYKLKYQEIFVVEKY